MKTIALTILSIALCGCAAVGPDWKPPVAQAPLDWSTWHGGAPALQAHDLANGAKPAFAHFADPVLAALQQQALAANHDLKTATINFAQSRKQRNITASADGPQLQARAGATRQAQSEAGSATRMVGIIAPGNATELAGALAQPFNVYKADFDASWELDLWGRVRRSIEAADASVSEREAALRQVQLSVSIEVARAYFELRAAQRQAQLAEADIAAAAEALELTAARHAGGLATALDVTRDSALLATLRAGAPLLLEQEARAINQLSLLTAANPGALQLQLAARKHDSDAAFGHTPDMALGIAADVAARRPDIQMAEARLHAATAGIGIAKADLYPRITLGASLGTEALSAGRFGDWGSRQWSIGPSLSLPLFDRGRRRATVELRELQQQEAAVQYQQTVLRAWTEVDNALSAYTAERLRRAQWQEREVSNAVALELATARYKQGMTDATPVLDAQRALIKARRDRIGSEAELSLRLLAICKAVGIAPQS